MDPSLDVRVQDEFAVHLDRSCKCTRRYIFRNGTSERLPLPSLISVELPSQVTSVDVSYDGREFAPVSVALGTYSASVNLSFSSQDIDAEATQEIQVRFVWTDFLSNQDHSAVEIALNHPFSFHYSARFTPERAGLLPNPRVSFTPPDPYLLDAFIVAREDAFISISPRLVPADTRFCATLHLSTRAAPDLPVLTALVREVCSPPRFADVVVVFVQHLLSDFLALFNAFRAAGLDPRNVFIVGIPYSTKPHVVQELRFLGVPLVSNPSSYPFDDAISTVLSNALAMCAAQHARLLVVEDGGYVSPLFQKNPIVSQRTTDLIGVVEQTANGIWEIESAFTGAAPNLSVLDVARSQLKREIEPPLIGEAVVRNIENLLGKREDSLRGRRVLLLGHGTIGSKILPELLRLQCTVTVSEPKAEIRPAENEHVTCINPNEMLLHLSRFSAIIGASGKVPLGTYQHFRALAPGTILVNATSKLREFDRDLLYARARRISLVPGVGTEVHVLNGPNVLLLAEGFPVNFYDSESVAGRLIQPILGLLLTGADYLVRTPEVPKGIVPFPTNLQERIRSIAGELTP